jgi:ABC transporter related protein
MEERSFYRTSLLKRLHENGCRLREEEILSAFSYNLDKYNQEADGIAILTKSELILWEGTAVKESYALSSIDKFVFRVDIGSVAVECLWKENNKPYIFCRGSMEHQKIFGHMVNKYNLFLEKGIYRQDQESASEHICPICGTPYKPGSNVCLNCVSKKKILRKLWDFLRPYKGKLILCSLLFIGVLLIGLANPYINRILVDSYVNNPKIQAAIASDKGRVFFNFLLVVLLMLAAYILNYIITIVRNLIMMQVGAQTIVHLRTTVFNKVQELSLSGISKKTTGELMNRVINDTQEIQNFINSQVPNVFGVLLQLIGISIILIMYDWKLLLIFLLPMPIAIIPTKIFWNFTRKIYNRQWSASSKCSTILHDIFSGIRVVKAFGTEAKETRRYDSAAARERDISIKNEMMYAMLSPFIRISLLIGNFLVLYYTGSKILNGSMTIGEAAMLSGYIAMVYGPINWLVNIPNTITRVFTSVVRIFDLLDEKTEVGDKNDSLEIALRGEIEFDHVSFSYDRMTDVLKDINLKIQPGEMIGLVGKSGVGKSTLINLVMRLYDVTEGSIRIDGIDIRDISQHSLRSQIGVVLQETILFAGSIYDNLLYAKADATREEIINAAKIAGAHEFIIKLPDGYNTIIGEKGHTLSGGERQRVAIARALLRNPKILILDEATASLDTEIEKQIQDSLQMLTSDRTTIAIAHRLSTLRNATRIVVLDQKGVAEVGSHEELLKQKGIYYDLVMAQRQMSKMSRTKQ